MQPQRSPKGACVFRRYQTPMDAVSRLECLKETKLSLRNTSIVHAQCRLFSFLDLKHIAYIALRYSKIFYAQLDRNPCFAAIDNRLRSIISGKWRLFTPGV